MNMLLCKASALALCALWCVSSAYGLGTGMYFELPDPYVVSQECTALKELGTRALGHPRLKEQDGEIVTEVQQGTRELVAQVQELCENYSKGKLDADTWLTRIDPIARKIDASIPCETCLRQSLPTRAPVPGGFKSYSLFLLPSGELDEDYNLVRELQQTFEGFGDAIGEKRAAIWFTNRYGRGVDIKRSKYYCDKFNLNYNDGPYVVTVGKRPDLLTNGDEITVIKLDTIEPSKMIRVLNVLEQDLRTQRGIRKRALIYEEIKQRALTLIERHRDALKGVVVELLKM